jgi:GT2 family glycosyltransferase
VTRRGAKRVIRGVPSAPTRTPSVTVVVPSYNYARFLPECASSVLGQLHVEVRLVIIDDASTDDTADVCARLLRADPRVSVTRHANNVGHIASVNEGIARVDTDYVVKLDADDMLPPGALARATALLEEFPNAAFAYGRPLHFSGAAPKANRSRSRSWTIWSGAEWIARRCRDGESAISQPETVIRTANLRQVGPVRSDLPHTSDLHLWLRLAASGEVGRVNGAVQGYYRVHDASMQRTVHAGELVRLRGRRDAFDAALPTMAGQVPGISDLHALVRRALAAEALDKAAHRLDRGRPNADDERIDDFVRFATETWPAARQLREWAALQQRQAFGAERAPRHPAFVAAAARRRARTEFRRWRWRCTGEF